MKITVRQHPTEVDNELTALKIQCADIPREFGIDLDFSEIVNRSWNAHPLGLDFLIFCASVYAIDKIVPRSAASDLWTRTLEIAIPARDPERWNAASEAFADAVSFLTGDRWSFTFTQAERDFARRRKNRRVHPKGFPQSPVVCLLSGGLDSFIGAVNLLNEYPENRILFVSHYDGHVSGPASDQMRLKDLLIQKYPRRISHLQVRTGASVCDGQPEKYKFETSFRSRSLMFLGLATYAALKVGPEIPIIIPENGPISLNMPLNPSRRGACSTRTVHPYFISSISEALRAVGILNPITNPYFHKTKGEMVKECSDSSVLEEAYELTNSCGKAGRKTHWQNRKAKACGVCVPCLLRRAALHSEDLDDEIYGNEAFSRAPADFADLHALLGLIRQSPTKSQIQKSLMANGRFKISEIDDYAEVVERMIVEVRAWIDAKGSPKARSLAGLNGKAR